MSLFKSNASAQQSAASAPAQAAVEPRHLTGAEFSAVIRDTAQPVVVDFWAEWCAPCKRIAPAVAKLAEEYEGRAVVAKVNADDDPEIVSQLGIQGIPTLVYFKGGEEVARIVGLTGYDAIKSKLERVLG